MFSSARGVLLFLFVAGVTLKDASLSFYIPTEIVQVSGRGRPYLELISIKYTIAEEQISHIDAACQDACDVDVCWRKCVRDATIYIFDQKVREVEKAASLTAKRRIKAFETNRFYTEPVQEFGDSEDSENGADDADLDLYDD